MGKSIRHQLPDLSDSQDDWWCRVYRRCHHCSSLGMMTDISDKLWHPSTIESSSERAVNWYDRPSVTIHRVKSAQRPLLIDREINRWQLFDVGRQRYRADKNAVWTIKFELTADGWRLLQCDILLQEHVTQLILVSIVMLGAASLSTKFGPGMS